MAIATGVTLRLLRTKPASSYLGISPWKLRELARDGKVAYVDYGDGPWLYDLRDLDTYIEAHKRPANSA